ncbi:MAG: hypothetical protein L0271_02970 [Gemmatimonadetes bacterium]|nr:hypothetical protein [Gemmatimonadota bacterium]
MDELFWVIVVIVFVIAPAIEKVLKGGTKAPPGRRVPPQAGRRPLPRSPADRTSATGPFRPAPPAQRRPAPSSEGASDLLPAELWEVLTGQRPAPRPPPPPDEDEEEIEEEEAPAEALPPARVESRDENGLAGDLLRRRQRELMAARQVDRRAPAIVSLESEPLPSRQRHAAFHRRVDRPAPPAVSREPREIPAADAVAALLQSGDTNQMRRAILMQEILGPPRGLE